MADIRASRHLLGVFGPLNVFALGLRNGYDFVQWAMPCRSVFLGNWRERLFNR